MSSTSIVPAAIDSLLEQINGALNGDLAGVTAFEVWPGPDATPSMVVLGEVTWDEYAIKTIKAGRQHRDEDFAVEFEVFVFDEDCTPTNPKPARDKGFAILAAVEDLLADDPQAALAADVVRWVEIRPRTSGLRLFESAYAHRIAGAFIGHARLT